MDSFEVLAHKHIQRKRTWREKNSWGPYDFRKP